MPNYQEIYYTFKHLSECQASFNEKKKVKSTIEALLWLIFLFFPAFLQNHIPSDSFSSLILYAGILFIAFIYVPKLTEKVLFIYLVRFNKDLDKKSSLYEKYNKLIKSSVLSVIQTGSDSFKSDVLAKITENSRT